MTRSGRPTDDLKDVTIQIRVSSGFLSAIDNWRRKQENIPSRSDAIRRLVVQALDSGKKLPKDS